MGQITVGTFEVATACRQNIQSGGGTSFSAKSAFLQLWPCENNCARGELQVIGRADIGLHQDGAIPIVNMENMIRSM